MRYLVTVLGPPRTFSRSFTIPENALAAIDELRQRQLTNIMIVDEHGRGRKGDIASARTEIGQTPSPEGGTKVRGSKCSLGFNLRPWKNPP